MNFKEAQSEFISTWGSLGSQWGISKSLAQVHAYFLSQSEPRTTEEVMERLQISRGNANTSIRELVGWGLLKKVALTGQRMDYYLAEKEVVVIAKKIMAERRKREIEPLRNALLQVDKFTPIKGKKEEEDFKGFMGDLNGYLSTVDKMIDIYLNSQQDWLIKLITRLKK